MKKSKSAPAKKSEPKSPSPKKVPVPKKAKSKAGSKPKEEAKDGAEEVSKYTQAQKDQANVKKYAVKERQPYNMLNKKDLKQKEAEYIDSLQK